MVGSQIGQSPQMFVTAWYSGYELKDITTSHISYIYVHVYIIYVHNYDIYFSTLLTWSFAWLAEVLEVLVEFE